MTFWIEIILSHKMSVNQIVFFLSTVGPVFTTNSLGQEVVIENSFTLVCIAEGFPRPSIQWYLNNTIITDSSNRVIVNTTSMNSITSTLTVMMAEFNDSGVYHCEADSSQSGLVTTNSDMVSITVVGEYTMHAHMHTHMHTHMHVHMHARTHTTHYLHTPSTFHLNSGLVLVYQWQINNYDVQ